VSDNEIISYEPATGDELWRGKVGDVEETSCARAAPGRNGPRSRSPLGSS
jgi:hypothetical protein